MSDLRGNALLTIIYESKGKLIESNFESLKIFLFLFQVVIGFTLGSAILLTFCPKNNKLYYLSN